MDIQKFIKFIKCNIKKISLLHILLFLFICILSNICIVKINNNPKHIIQNHFKYLNKKNKKKLLTTLTSRYNNPNLNWGLKNIEYIKIIKMQEEQNLKYKKDFIISTNSSIKNLKQKNIKVFKVYYKVKYNKNKITPQDSGKYTRHYYLIKKCDKSTWLIDYISI